MTNGVKPYMINQSLLIMASKPSDPGKHHPPFQMCFQVALCSRGVLYSGVVLKMTVLHRMLRDSVPIFWLWGFYSLSVTASGNHPQEVMLQIRSFSIRSSCIPGLQWDRMRSEHLGRSKQCGLRVCPPLLHSCKMDPQGNLESFRKELPFPFRS